MVPNRIDILADIEGVTFEQVWSTRMTAHVAGQQIPVLGRQASLRNKKAGGRKKDLLDAHWLEEPDEPA